MPPAADPSAFERLSAWENGWRLGVVWIAGGLFWFLIFSITPVGQGEADYPGAVDALLLLDVVVGHVVILLVAFRRRWPVGVAVLATVLSTVSVWSWAAVLLSVMSLATRRRLPPLVVVGVLNVLVGAVHETWLAPSLFPDNPDYYVGGNMLLSVSISSVISLLLLVIVALIGWNIGSRRELVATWRNQAQTANSEQAARVAQAQLAERARIAREMHDVLAHRLSLVAMHAGVLVRRPDLSEEERASSAEVVRAGAHQALEELREVLGVLRTDRGEEDDEESARPVEAPQPGLTGIPTLVAEVTSNGQEVSLDVDPDLWPRSVSLPTSTGRHAYRVVQEGLTNARKHAPSRPVAVSVQGRAGQGLELAISNRAAPLGEGTLPSGGRGVTGMAERVQLAGGTFEAGMEITHFVVRVWLPWPKGGGKDDG